MWCFVGKHHTGLFPILFGFIVLTLVCYCFSFLPSVDSFSLLGLGVECCCFRFCLLLGAFKTGSIFLCLFIFASVCSYICLNREQMRED